MSVILEAKNLSKSFYRIKALDKVNFELRGGEIHALLGENGAGKSTMMKIFSGVYTKDEGDIYFQGQKVEYTTPKEALTLGISTIYQELNLCPHLSIMHNIFLNREFVKYGQLNDKEQEKHTYKILQLLNLDMDPYTKVCDIPIAKKQLVEIAKAISMQSKVLIMDEPTSSLSENETQSLFKVMRNLRDKGYGIIYISHRLEELHQIADRMTIFRDGKFITTKNSTECSVDDLVTFMAGREISEKYPRIFVEKGNKRVQVINFSKDNLFKDISFDLYSGEVLGIAGLMGAGRTELAKGIFGVYGKVDGKLIIDGKTLKISSPEDAINEGIAYIPEDRKLEGLAINMSLWENFTIPSAKELSSKIGILDHNKIFNITNEYIQKLQIKVSTLYQKTRDLSGGNQQKVTIGKWLAKKPKLIIFDEPTRGVDVNAKVSIYELIQQLKQEGIALIVISSELQEIFGVSDRIMVLSNGRVTGIVDIKETNQEEIIKLATS